MYKFENKFIWPCYVQIKGKGKCHVSHGKVSFLRITYGQLDQQIDLQKMTVIHNKILCYQMRLFVYIDTYIYIYSMGSKDDCTPHLGTVATINPQ